MDFHVFTVVLSRRLRQVMLSSMTTDELLFFCSSVLRIAKSHSDVEDILSMTFHEQLEATTTSRTSTTLDDMAVAHDDSLRLLAHCAEIRCSICSSRSGVYAFFLF